MNRIWRNGIFGVVIGDALGCPVQFESRLEVSQHPIKGMRGFGTFNLPEGSWTDDSSLTLALLSSINEKDDIDLNHIMDNFVKWLEDGKFTPYGFSYDIGGGTMNAIKSYERNKDVRMCGGRSESNNGNGSLMRIMPVCLYCYEKGMSDENAVRTIFSVASLTHAHIRSNFACSLYYFMVKAILSEDGELIERMQKGLDNGFEFLEKHFSEKDEIAYFDRLRNLYEFSNTHVSGIKSSGYVVDTIEASVWSLVTTNSFEEALLTAVNLGNDTDTVGAIAGGLGGLYYGMFTDKGIPSDWYEQIQRKEWIAKLCEYSDKRLNAVDVK